MGYRILFIDDDKGWRDIVRETLTKEGYEVNTAEDGDEGLKLLQSATDQPYDLVISDWKMPKMDGLELLKKIRKLRLDLHFILKTAFGGQLNTNITIDFLRNGCYDIIISHSLEEISIRVKKALEDLSRKRQIRELGANEQEVSILFADIIGFTRFTELMKKEGKSEEVAIIVNAYLSLMSDIIFLNDGIIDKYIGDEIMAIFDDVSVRHNKEENHAIRAVKSAVEIRQTIDKEIDEGKKWYRVHIGINTGKAIVGMFGTSRRKDFSVIGDTVNVASRLTAGPDLQDERNKTIRLSREDYILISEETLKKIPKEYYKLVSKKINLKPKDKFLVKEIGNMYVKNKIVPIKTYEVI